VNDPTAILEARGICRRAGGRTLLSDVSLAVGPGQRVAVVGATGSGKSLLLRSLALLDPLDGGEIHFWGRPVAPADVPSFRRQVIYLHQRPALAEGTVADNLRRALQLKVHRHRKLEPHRAERLLSQLGRDTAFLQQTTENLSGGEAQLVALLRAIQLEPILLLLDEPSAALDADSTRLVEQLVAAWHTEARDTRAVLWVSHDAAQVQRVADRVLHMKRGVLEASSET
jgi:putative ABC transport system ATP-binding protein